MKAVTIKKMSSDMSEIARPNINIASVNKFMPPLPLPLSSLNRGSGNDSNMSPPRGVAELYFSDRIQGRSRQSSRSSHRQDVGSSRA